MVFPGLPNMDVRRIAVVRLGDYRDSGEAGDLGPQKIGLAVRRSKFVWSGHIVSKVRHLLLWYDTCCYRKGSARERGSERHQRRRPIHDILQIPGPSQFAGPLKPAFLNPCLHFIRHRELRLRITLEPFAKPVGVRLQRYPIVSATTEEPANV